MSDLIDLVLVFARISLVAFGGGIGILPEMERLTVGQHHWVTHQEFVDAFALSQVTPGPGMLMVTVIGYRAAGIPGAAVAGLSMFLPTSALAWFIADRWGRVNDRPIMRVFRRTLSPVALGLLGAGCYTLFRIAVAGPVAFAIAGISLATVAIWKVSPVWVVAGGAVAGIVLLR